MSKTYVDYYCYRPFGGKSRLESIIDTIIIKNFGWLPEKDLDDFYSIGNQVVWSCQQTYDDNKDTKFATYLYSCLMRKIKTRVTHMNRQKRSSGMPDVSIDAVIDEEDGRLTLGDYIAADNRQDDIREDIELYLETLSITQREVAELIMLGYNSNQIKDMLDLSERRYNAILQRIKTKGREEIRL